MTRIQTKLLICLIMAFTISMFAQTDSTKANGDWNAASTWKSGSVPTGSGIYIIRSSDSVYFNVAATITGTVKTLSGKIGVFDSSKVVFKSGSTYEHAVNGGTLPKVTWDSGSTCLVTGVTGNAPSNGRQDFYNFTWSCLNQNANLNLGMSGNTIKGNFQIDTTAGSRIYLTAPNAYTSPITIKGNLIVKKGQFAVHGSSTTLVGPANYLVTVEGNIIVDGDIGGASFAPQRGSATPVFLEVKGNMSITNSSITTSNNLCKIIFAKAGTQTLTISGTTGWTSGNTITWEVASTSTLNFGTSVISGAASIFMVDSAATVNSGSATGLDGNINTGGVNVFSPKANYGFNGSVAQVTGTKLPATLNNLTINNAAGVTLSQATAINGILTLKSGVFDNTIPFTLGPSGSVVNQGGSLKIPFTSVRMLNENGIPQSFFVQQNYPNPFNPTTTIVFGLAKNGFVSAKIFTLLGQEVAEVMNEYKNAGEYSINFNASHLSSGVYLYRIQSGNSVDAKRMVLMK